jgi:hypothetical protein
MVFASCIKSTGMLSPSRWEGQSFQVPMIFSGCHDSQQSGPTAAASVTVASLVTSKEEMRSQRPGPSLMNPWESN